MPRFTSSSPYITSDNEVLVNFVALTDEGTEQERNGFQVEYEIGKKLQGLVDDYKHSVIKRNSVGV